MRGEDGREGRGGEGRGGDIPRGSCVDILKQIVPLVVVAIILLKLLSHSPVQGK